MGRKEDLEQNIRGSYELIGEYEEILRLSSDPKEKTRAQRTINEQRGLIQSWLEEYRQISGVLPNYIAEIADFPLLRAVNEIGGWMNSQGYAFEALEISEGPRFIKVDARLFQGLRWDNWEPAQNLAQLVLSADRATQQAFIAYIARRLQSEDEEVRWTTGMLVETLVEWEPSLVPLELVERLASDSSFSVRSSAALCYFHLAHSAPAQVPLSFLVRLASPHEDWYVTQPATAALLVLARTRRVVIDVIRQWSASDDPVEREHAANVLRRMALADPELVPKELAEYLCLDTETNVRVNAELAIQALETAGWPKPRDYSPF